MSTLDVKPDHAISKDLSLLMYLGMSITPAKKESEITSEANQIINKNTAQGRHVFVWLSSVHVINSKS